MHVEMSSVLRRFDDANVIEALGPFHTDGPIRFACQSDHPLLSMEWRMSTDMSDSC